MKGILDVCCGGKMFWYDKHQRDTIFADIRNEEHLLSNGQLLSVSPDVIADFRDIPFEDNSFSLVVFDPPHLKSLGKSRWRATKYGTLLPTRENDIKQGFNECFRVLKPEGVLIFKWNEYQIPLQKILDLSPQPPLFGHQANAKGTTHWIAFMKDRE